MATEAEQDAADFGTTTRDGAGQNFDEASIVTEGDGLAVQGAGVLSPKSIAAGIGFAAVTGTKRSAVRGVTACAAAALIVVGAEDVNGRRPILGNHQTADSQ